MEYLAFDFFSNPSKRVYWLYIISSFILAILYFYITKKSSKAILSSKLWLHPSAKLDYIYFFLANIVNIILIIPLVLSAKSVALFTNKFLYENFGFFESINLSFTQITVLYTIAIFVFSDFTRYWLHRFLHTIPFLWEFH
ncbi:sterol desaturase family protein, partial [Aliarcobacter skirrowii]|nr:sterol desaturase family protein [Aliarcobacter skirrowii]